MKKVILTATLAFVFGACATVPTNTTSSYDSNAQVTTFKRSLGPVAEPVMRSQSGVSAFEIKDEMEGTATYHITLRSEDYESYTNEDELSLDCAVDGDVSASFHWGGRHSGGGHGPSMTYTPAEAIHLKFDDEATKAATYDYFKDKQVMRWFLGKVKAHQRLFIKSGHPLLIQSASVYRFRVGMPGWNSRSLAVIAKFEQQCLRGATSSSLDGLIVLTAKPVPDPSKSGFLDGTNPGKESGRHVGENQGAHNPNNKPVGVPPSNKPAVG